MLFAGNTQENRSIAAGEVQRRISADGETADATVTVDMSSGLVQHDLIRQRKGNNSQDENHGDGKGAWFAEGRKAEKRVRQNDVISPESLGIQPGVGQGGFLRGLFGNWTGQDMAMDLGTANTLVYVRGRGIVLNEPSVVAIREDDRKPVAVGRAAKEMYGKTCRNIRCVRPMKDGVIADFDITHIMIREFITRVSHRWQLRRPRLIVSIPSGVTMVEKRAVVDAALASGARQVNLIEEPMAAAIGSGVAVREVGGNMIVDIGGGTTEVAVISLGATAYAESVRIAGDEMDEAIETFIRRAFNLQVGIFEAERIKLTIGSAMPMAQPREMKIFGRDLATGVPREMIIDDSIVRRALREPVSAIVDAVIRALERTSPELAEDIIRKGVFLAGGGALLAGLPERLSLESGLKFLRAADPLTAIVRGTGQVVEAFKDYKCVCIS